MQRWLSWSKAHDWKSCVRLITDREFESLPLREQERESLWFSFFFCKERAKAIFFSLDYFIPLRNSTGMKIHFILSENGEERLASFRLIVSTAVEGCHYAWGAQGDSDAVSLWIYAHGGVWLIWLASVSAHLNRLVARFSIIRSSGA